MAVNLANIPIPEGTHLCRQCGAITPIKLAKYHNKWHLIVLGGR